MRPDPLAADYANLDAVRFLFSPIAHLVTGVVLGVEIQPRIRDRASADMVASIAAADGGLMRPALDAGVAIAGIRWGCDVRPGMALQVNLLADTLVVPGVLDEVHMAVVESGRKPSDVVIGIGPPIGDPDPAAVSTGARHLRSIGYRLAINDVGPDDLPLALLARVEPDMVKLSADVLAGLDDDPGCAAVVETVRTTCHRSGAVLVADGITDSRQLVAVRRNGIMIGQGSLLGEPARRPPVQVTIPLVAATELAIVPDQPRSGPERTRQTPAVRSTTAIAQFARPTVTMPVDATGDDIRNRFSDSPALTSIVLVDGGSRPVALLDRNRFMLAVSGLFGHALHSKRPVRELADPPRTLPDTADPRALLELMPASGSQRTYDDIVVTRPDGTCRGIARVADVLRGIAVLDAEIALARHPVTGLPGQGALAGVLREWAGAETDLVLGVLTLPAADLVRRLGMAAASDVLRELAGAAQHAIRASPGGGDVLHGPGDTILVLAHAGCAPSLETTVRTALEPGAAADALRATWRPYPRGRVDQQQLAGDLADAIAGPVRAPQPG